MKRKTSPSLGDYSYLLNRDLVRSIDNALEKAWPKGREAEKILDIGCGKKPYRHLMEKHCEQYLGCDLYSQDPGDISCPADALEVEDSSMDGVVCFQVVEHVPAPEKVIAEIQRVLKPGGRLVLTAPFIYPYHPSPGDYYRFTQEGLEELVSRAGLEVVHMEGQCETVKTPFLLVSHLLGTIKGKFEKRNGLKILSPIVFLMIVSANICGLATSGLFRALDKIDKSNHMFANILIIARKPG